MANKVFPVVTVGGTKKFAISKKSGENAKFIICKQPVPPSIDLDAFQIANKNLTIVEDR